MIIGVGNGQFMWMYGAATVISILHASRIRGGGRWRRVRTRFNWPGSKFCGGRTRNASAAVLGCSIRGWLPVCRTTAQKEVKLVRAGLHDPHVVISHLGSSSCLDIGLVCRGPCFPVFRPTGRWDCRSRCILRGRKSTPSGQPYQLPGVPGHEGPWSCQ